MNQMWPKSYELVLTGDTASVVRARLDPESEKTKDQATSGGYVAEFR